MAELQESFQIDQIWPLIIRRTCARCGREFKWQWGWRASAGKTVWGYLCQECAPARRTARNYFFLLQAIAKLWRKASSVRTHG